MFNVGTILERKKPLNDDYDVVKIIGTNPVKGASTEEWAASGNQGVLVQPIGFGATRPISFAQIGIEYNVQLEAADGMPIQETESGSQESPEAHFAKAQAAEAAEQTIAAKKAQQAATSPSTPSPTDSGTGTSTPKPAKR